MISKQEPIGSGFGFKTTAAEVIAGHDLTGKLAIVTGGYSGIGLETTRAFASAGAHVIVPARDMDKAQNNLKDVAGVELAQLDLIDPGSIDSFAREFLNSQRPVHILVNNAGIMAVPLIRDTRGYESQFATNHLGHFQLTARLWPALLEANGARVISVSSRGHRFSGVDFDDPNFERRAYDRWVAYGQSKTANILFAVALDERGQANGVRAFSLHPGRIIDTALSRYMTEEELAPYRPRDMEQRDVTNPEDYVKNVRQGAATSVWCATSNQLDGMGGVYCEDCDVAPIAPADSDGLGVRPYAIDPELAERLWSLSVTLTAAQIAS
ncbi:MAG: SDR family NAD(P)-dependent oxidoreductase [Candidatus Eremiobacteraeota bacterium]|nr:SDR family NAD(P)-dependent oxidoreductase [Candidatus Eremiobacteraeota bacterium]